MRSSQYSEICVFDHPCTIFAAMSHHDTPMSSTATKISICAVAIELYSFTLILLSKSLSFWKSDFKPGHLALSANTGSSTTLLNAVPFPSTIGPTTDVLVTSDAISSLAWVPHRSIPSSSTSKLMLHSRSFLVAILNYSWTTRVLLLLFMSWYTRLSYRVWRDKNVSGPITHSSPGGWRRVASDCNDSDSWVV